MGETAIDAAEPRFSGFVDDFASGRLHGWVADRLEPGFDACVVVFAGDDVVGACRADIIRPDLAPLMPGEGRHGFDCSLSEEVFDADRIDVYAVTREVFEAVTRVEVGDDRRPRTQPEFLRDFGQLCGRIEGTNQASLGLRDLRAGPARGAVDGPGLILVDIGDLLAYHRTHLRVSGIQRVLCGLIATLPTIEGTAGLDYCLLSERPGVVNVVDKARVEHLVATLLGSAATRQELDAQIGAVEASGRPFWTRPTDTFFIVGAFWIHDRLARHLVRMREHGTRLVLTVHDLIPLTHPHLVSVPTRRAFGEHAVQALPQFDFLFTTSRFVAAQARSILTNEVGQAPPIRAMPLPHRSIGEARQGGRGEEIARAASSRSAMTDEPFVLCVGTIEARKNHMILYRVWAALLRKHGRAAVPRLVLAGRWGWNVGEFRQALDGSDNLDGAITVLSDVDDGALASLYRRTLFTVFPSFAEGWGLPVGESLAAGKLCVASRTTAVPEVGGEFCAYFDPHDVLDAFAAIERPIFDRDWLSARERHIAAAFRPRSWADTATEILRGLQAIHAEFRAGAEGTRGLVFGAADAIDFTAPSPDDDTVSWRSRMAGSVLAAGWHLPDRDGVSASARTSTIALTTDRKPGARTTVLLRLAGTGRERPCRVSVAGGCEVAHLAVAGRRPRWYEVDAMVGPGGRLRLAVSGPADVLLASGGRGSGFALLGLALCGSGDDGRARSYRKLLDAAPLPGRPVRAEPDAPTGEP